MRTVTKANYRNKRKRVEYKYAFGQMIPKDFSWRVKQRASYETSEKKYVKYKDQVFQIEYDQNGRRIKKVKIP